jgi:hypothetical protein
MNKITFRIWAALQSGSVSSVYDRTGRCSIKCSDGLFILRGPGMVHSLDADATDLDRLQAHWRGIIQAA